MKQNDRHQKFKIRRMSEIISDKEKKKTLGLISGK